MIAIQGYKESKDSIFLIFDNEGINEMIDYLNFIKDKDSSMHLSKGNELSSDNEEVEDDMYLITHVKLINIDKL